MKRTLESGIRVLGFPSLSFTCFCDTTYIDARVTEDNTIPIGNRLNNSAQHTASLWTTYEIQNGGLKGFGGGLGLFFAGDRPGDSLNTQVQPQPGDFYGGWITSDIVGPFKGSPGT